MSGDNDFVVVANRLPVDLDSAGNWTPSPGGLVAALTPVLSSHNGCWVGWPGIPDTSPEPFRTDEGVLLHPVTLTEADFREFYEGFSNATLWPLYHDLIVTPVYDRSWWERYRDVNDRFAREVDRVAAPGATVWVQDYQLQLVPGILRQIRPDLTIGFFLHIPFPGPDLFRQLPWREEIVRGLLGADLLGFHLESGAANFLDLLRHVGIEVSGTVRTREVTAFATAGDGRPVGVAAYPISIDPASLGESDNSAVEKRRAELGDPATVLLGVDRLDYTKGILPRLTALEELLEAGSLEPGDVAFVQVATPSRERLEEYRRARSEVEEAVGRINGRFGTIGRPVVHYLHQALPKRELRHYYSVADVMVVTPYKDGMNLVAKEYVACHPDGSGSLVLSEFAGAAEELTQANLCNPFDGESIKAAMLQAITGLRSNPDEMARRMTAMYEQVSTHDVDAWARAFLSSLAQT